VCSSDLPRRFLKIEIQYMKKIWEQKAPKQARWTSQYPTQILKQSKRVWTWAAAAGKGSAWIYYIFAISQWLPTNQGVHYSDTGELDLHKCKLCLLNVVEDTDHISTCPALASEHVKLQTIIEQKLRTWHISSVEKEIESLEEHTYKSWFRAVRSVFAFPDDLNATEVVSSERLWFLTKEFWSHNPNSNLKRFMDSLHATLKNSLSYPSEVTYKDKCVVGIPNALLTILAQSLQLQVEGNSNALHRSPLSQNGVHPSQ